MKIIDPNQSSTASALEIQDAIDEISGFVSARLSRIYAIVNTPGRQQVILDRIGVKGLAAFQAYIAFQQAMELINPGSVPPPDMAVFSPREDGSIEYVAPEESP